MELGAKEFKEKLFYGIIQGGYIVQVLTAFTGDISALASGMHYGWSSPSLPKLLSNDSYIPVTNEEADWITTMLLFGTICGALLTGIVLDVLGRKATILLSAIPFFISWLCIAFSTEMYQLLIARFLAGIGDGLVQCALPVYVGEIADSQRRGFLGSAISCTWFCGMLIVNIIGSYFSIQECAMISSSIPVFFLITFYWMPDSPYYFVKKGKLDSAKKSLELLNGDKSVDIELETIQAAVAAQCLNGDRLIDVFISEANRKSFWLMIGMRTVQQFCGIVAVMFYAQIIIKQGGGPISPELGSTIFFGVFIIFLALCSALVDRVGRKPLLVFSIVGSGVVLLIKSLYFACDVGQLTWIPITTIIAYAVFFSLGMQSIPMLLQGELFPVNIKAKAISISIVYFAIVSSVVLKIFQITSEHFGLYVPLFLFTASCFIGVLFIVYLLPETKGKSLEDIQVKLNRSNVKQCETVSTELYEHNTHI